MVPKITGSNFVSGSGRVTPSGKHQAFGHQEVDSRLVPAERERLNKKIGKPAPAPGSAEIRDARILGLDIRVEGACSRGKYQVEAQISTCDFDVRYIIENIFNGPHVVTAGDGNSAAARAVECIGVVPDRDVCVGKTR